MDLFPTEVWYVIINELSIKDLLNIRLVCKNFNQLTQSEFFIKHNRHSKFIEDILSWKQTRFDLYAPSKENDKDVHLLGSCIRYGKLDKFDNLLAEVRVKRISFRMNWVNMFEYAGMNGTDEVLDFLKDKVPHFGPTHGTKYWESCVIHGNIESAEKNGAFSHYPENEFIVKLLINNNEAGINYYLTKRPSILSRFIINDELLKILVHTRNDKLIKKAIEYRKTKLYLWGDTFIQLLNALSSNKNDIDWALKTGVIDLSDEENVRKLKLAICTKTLLTIVETGYIDKNDIDWTKQINKSLDHKNLAIFTSVIKSINNLNIIIDYNKVINYALKVKYYKDIIKVINILESNSIILDYSAILKDCFTNDRTQSYKVLKYLHSKTIK